MNIWKYGSLESPDVTPLIHLIVTTGSVLEHVSISVLWGGEVEKFNESGRQKVLANKATDGHCAMGDADNIQM